MGERKRRESHRGLKERREKRNEKVRKIIVKWH